METGLQSSRVNSLTNSAGCHVTCRNKQKVVHELVLTGRAMPSNSALQVECSSVEIHKLDSKPQNSAACKVTMFGVIAQTQHTLHICPPHSQCCLTTKKPILLFLVSHFSSNILTETHQVKPNEWFHTFWCNTAKSHTYSKNLALLGVSMTGLEWQDAKMNESSRHSQRIS